MTTSLDGGPFDAGTYMFDGSTVTLGGEPGQGDCLGATGVYEVTFEDADTMSMERIEDGCVRRPMAVGTWERIRINSPQTADLGE